MVTVEEGGNGRLNLPGQQPTSCRCSNTGVLRTRVGVGASDGTGGRPAAWL